MEREYLTTGLRARAAQLMAWLQGPAQNQQRQQQENDRNTRDGITHGEEDPDNRRQLAMATNRIQPTSTSDTGADLQAAMRLTVHNVVLEASQQRDAVHDREIERALARQAREMDSGYRPHQERLADLLSARMEALQQSLVAQQDAQQQALGRTEAGPPQAQTAPRYAQMGYDGPDDVRIPRELGPVSGHSAAEISLAYERAKQAAEREDTSAPTQDRLASFKASIADLQDRVVALRAQAPDQSRPQERARGRGQGMEY